MKTTDPEIISKATAWLSPVFDPDTRMQVKQLIDNDPDELVECFYRNLEFGTGGLRGIMGVGTNRMNKYTVGMATQGLVNYLKKAFPGKGLRAAIAYDSRNNSRYFADISAEVLSANGIEAYLFDDIRPTPVLSFAIRQLHCHTGIMITASHNPKEYNGYKVYWADGGQLVPPHDKNVIQEVLAIASPQQVYFDPRHELIHAIGAEVDAAYIEKSKTLSLSPELNRRFSDLKIVYTPIHGTGVRLTPMLLKAFGFQQIIPVEAQEVPDGNFPTVHSPNPEESEALTLALQHAKQTGADLVMATDPDADRVGVAVKDLTSEFVLLNGNQTASLLTYYLLKKWQEKGLIKGREYIVKTIVTSELLAVMADAYGVACYDVLTGFKYIAEIIRNLEGKKIFIGGGEESYGFLVGDFVRDKDALIACAMIAEAAAWAKSQNKSLYNVLLDIYLEYGFYKEKLLSVTKKGKAGAEEIALLMQRYRSQPPLLLAQTRVVSVKDYKLQADKNLIDGTQKPIDLPKSDVLQFILEDGSKITVRPSGTEPKIKFYFGVKGILHSVDAFDALNLAMERRIEQMIDDLKI